MTYKTTKGAANRCTQLTAQELINGRFHHVKKGWTEFSVADFNQQIDAIVLLIGGRKKADIAWALKYRKPQHWGLKRIMYNAKTGRWSYCAGQDYPGELNQIREYLYKIQ